MRTVTVPAVLNYASSYPEMSPRSRPYFNQIARALWADDRAGQREAIARCVADGLLRPANATRLMETLGV